jgi:hypothetical protein
MREEICTFWAIALQEDLSSHITNEEGLKEAIQQV